MATILVRFYLFWHGRMKCPGAGLLLRLFRGVLPGLRNYPLIFPGTGTARLDFRDQASFSLLNYKAGDWGNHRFLFGTMATRLRPGEVLWDVGANVGLVSLHFSQAAFGLKKIHAFEPSSGPRKSLQALLGSHPNVCVHPFGLSSSAWQGRMKSRQGDSSYSTVVPAEDAQGGESIRLEQGDALVASGMEPPHVIKVDVEGHEPKVFAGLKETIRIYQPIIFFEHIFLSDEQIRELTPPGYRLSFLHEDGFWSLDIKTRQQGHEALAEPAGI